MTAGVMRNAHHPLTMKTWACEARHDVCDVEVEGENVESGGTAHRPLDCPRGRVLDVRPCEARLVVALRG